MDASSGEASRRIGTLGEAVAPEVGRRQKMQIVVAVLLGLFLGALDQTIVGPALPTVVTQLSGGDYYVWVVTAYLLTSTNAVTFSTSSGLASVTPPSGRA